MNSLIKAEGIEKKFGTVNALRGISLEVSEGSITGLIGPDGAGKSTMMKIALTLLKRDGGSISVLSVNSDNDKTFIRQNVGYMPEIFSLYTDLTVEENLNFYFTIHKMDKQDYEKKRERLYRFSRLEAFTNTKAGSLSGGMKQKLALSCALMHDPKLLILDEPTTGVDPLSRQEFWGMLHELKEEGVGILVSTPYMEEALKCDFVYMMNKGKIIGEGIPENLSEEFEGSLYEFEIPGRKPQEFLSELKQIFRGDSVFMSGKKVHLALRGAEELSDIRTKTTSLDPELLVRKKVPELEDIFIIRVLAEGSDGND
ncbi:MAG: ABC transporter ATP-binding protein [Spirochaetia bacterium]|jgi:ABC-2 type transport system ATP-binding protein|nr:ABC transporter ATP-binding protein [Spirochaetia bacterium]